MFIEEKIFSNLCCFNVRVTQKDVDNFIDAISDHWLPDVITFDVDEAMIRIDRKQMEFRILKRYKTNNQFQSDMLLATAIKVAIKSGFKLFLEPKFSN